MTCFTKGLAALRAATLLLAWLSILEAGKPIVVKLATLAPEGSPWHKLLLEMRQEWRQATNGEVDLRIYPGGVAGDERDMIRKIRIGQLHAAAVTIEGLGELAREMNVFYVPLMVNSNEELDLLRKGLSPELERKVSEGGFVLLNWADVGWAYWFTREPMSTPAQLRDQKLFTWAGDYHAPELWKRAGFHPVPLASVDLLTSLQTGVVDAVATTPLAALSFQWFALAPHMSDMKWGPMVGAVIMSRSMWESIPAEHHPKLQAIGERMEAKARALAAEADRAVEMMEKRGLRIHKLSETELHNWREFTKTFYPLLRGSLVPAEIFDRAMDLKKEMDSRKSGRRE